jgi:hypothetical protein
VHEDVKDEASAVLEPDDVGGFVSIALEEKEENVGRVAAIEGEVRPVGLQTGAEWVEPSWRDFARRVHVEGRHGVASIR